MPEQQADRPEPTRPAAARLRAEIKRLRDAAGLSQPGLAHRIGYTRQYVSLAERGTNLPSHDLTTALDTALAANGALLRLREQARREQTALRPGNRQRTEDSTAKTAPPVSFDDRLSPASCESDDVERRDFLKLTSVMVSSGVTGSLRTTLVSPPEVEGDDAERLRTHLNRLRALDDHLGGVDTYPWYDAETAKTEELLKLKQHRSDARSALLEVLCEQHQQAGWAAFDAGWQERARVHYSRAFTAAREAGAADLAANTLAFRAYQLSNLARNAIGITQRSVDLSRAATPGVQALINQRAAWVFAVAGRPERTAQLLDCAATAMTQHDAEDTPRWAIWSCNPVEQDIIAGRCWAELHRPLRAVPLLEAAMQRYDDSHARDKALYLAALASAYADAHEPERAATVADRALTLAEGVASARPTRHIRSLATRLASETTAESVTRLSARCAANPV